MNAMKQRLQAVLASYGADPARWPVADRAELLPHLASAGDALDEARLIDGLLDLTGPPQPQSGFEKRLMARIAMRPPPRARFSLGWQAALPLAASLALGIYLGAMGELDRLFPSAVTGDVAAVDDDDGDVDGVTEATDYSGDQIS
jgi:hypothetical protein